MGTLSVLHRRTSFKDAEAGKLEWMGMDLLRSRRFGKDCYCRVFACSPHVDVREDISACDKLQQLCKSY